MSRYSTPATALAAPASATFSGEPAASKLSDSARMEVMEFLAKRPLQTIMLTGMVADNGLASSLNRGDFYGCRNRAGELEAVALIGHFVLMEARSDRAVQELARVASDCAVTRMIMGESHVMHEFWTCYSPAVSKVKHNCRERLLEANAPIETIAAVPGLRLATRDDLELLIPVHAWMAFEESGIDPMERDPKGFRSRYLRRIEQKRTWVLLESRRVIFKAEIVSDTPEIVYLEGVWIDPESRCQGLGTRCLSQLVRQLLSRDSRRSVCVFVNERNPAAIRFYEGAGFKSREVHETVFLQETAS